MPDPWLMHRDQMERLHLIEKLLTEAVHERRAARKELLHLSQMIKDFMSEPKASFDWKAILDTVLARLLLAVFLGGSGIVAWVEAIKLAFTIK